MGTSACYNPRTHYMNILEESLKSNEKLVLDFDGEFIATLYAEDGIIVASSNAVTLGGALGRLALALESLEEAISHPE